MTPNERSREAAYADLVSGLIDARIDVASERFDAELEAAEAAGRLDPATARLLRWWQRESVRSVTEHARTTVPATLVALEKAEREAREAVHRADAAWTTARGVSARAAFSSEPPSVTTPSVTAPSVTAPVAAASEQSAPATSSSTPAPAAGQNPAASQNPESAPSRPVAEPTAPKPAAAPAPAATVPSNPAHQPEWKTLEPPNYPSGPLDPASRAAAGSTAQVSGQPTASPTGPVPPSSYPTTPGEAPGIVDLTAHEEPADADTTPAGRRRTLLAGLTVLPRTD